MAVVSEAFRPNVEVWSPSGERLWSTYAKGKGAVAAETGVLPVSGRYEVRAIAVDDRIGAYHLEVATVAKSHLVVDTPVASALDEPGSVGIWTFDAIEGQVLRVAAASESFDPSVTLRMPNGEHVDGDDDSGPGTDSWLQATLPATGRYEVWVRAVYYGTGAYRLTVDAVAAARLAVNAPVTGTLDDHTPVAVWGFEGSAGQMLRVAARSDAFTPAVELLSQTGGRIRGCGRTPAARIPTHG